MAAINLVSSFKSVLSRLSLPQTTSVAVAVSGGSDSLALTYLAKQVFDRVVGITIDHKIRPESEEESLRAKEAVLGLGAEHRLVPLQWPGNVPPTKKIQLLCRDKRYEALANVCHNENIKLLLVGHHWNDQIETIVHRIARNSAINGLCGILPIIHHSSPPITVCRPLLEFKKDSLVQLCKEKNLKWVEDPTNSHPVYWRNVIRELLTEYPGLSEGLYDFKNTCEMAKHKANNEVLQCLQKISVNQTYGYVSMDWNLIESLPTPIALRLLHCLTQYVTGTYRGYATLKLKVVFDAIRRDNFKCASHSSCNIFAIDHKTIGVAREPEKRGTPSEPIQLGKPFYWKNRFVLTLSPLSNTIPPTNANYHVRCMNREDANQLHRGIRKVRSSMLPHEHIRGGLPVVIDKGTGRVVLIPHFKVNDTSYGIKCDIKFKLPRSLKECLQGPDENRLD